MSRINRIIFVLSLIGLTVSAYLAYEYSLNSPIACPLTGSGCEVVKKSSYSKFLGIQLPYFGLVFYLVLASLSVFLSQTFNKLPRTESPRFSLKVYKKLQKTLPLYTTYPAEVCNHLSIHPRFEKTGFSASDYKSINLLRFLISFFGVVFGLYLTALEAFVIGAYCIWCIASFIVSIFIFFFCIRSLKYKPL